MSWRTGECECGNTVNYGIYYSEHEDDLSEINVTVICGVCVRERDGIPSENEVDEHFENFKSKVEKQGLSHVIFSALELLNPHSFEIQNLKFFEMLCAMYESDEDNSEIYINAAWSIMTKR